MLKDTKETIISRMIRTASGLWGYPDTQDISSFDPLVAMIFSAVAEELSHIATEIKNSDARLVEKVFELVFSQQEFSHTPAHAILRAKPQQASVSVSSYYQFIYKLKAAKLFGNETVFETRDIGFTPTASVRLFKAEPRYIVAGNRLFELTDRFREPIAESASSPENSLSRLYIGLQIDNLVDRLDGLSLMFSMTNKLAEERLFHALASSRWKLNGRDLAFVQGVDAEEEDMGNSLHHLLRKESDVSFRSCNYVNAFYRKRFATLSGNNYMLKDFKALDWTFERLDSFSPAGALEAIPAGIYWLEIDFQQNMPPDLLHGIQVTTNCFPVINRQLNEFAYSLYKGTNVIPLLTQELFFDMDRVSDSRDKLYGALDNHADIPSGEDGYYLRQGGIARFDARAAVETIRNLIDLVRDERAGFSVLGADMIASELKQLDQIITRLQNRIDSSNVVQESGSYLLLRCSAESERARIRFWTTNGEEANNIRPDSSLGLQRGSDIDSRSIILVTNTIGGSQKLTGEQKIYKLRRSLLSRGRVVTPEDIKALCMEEFGSDLKGVTITKGNSIDPDPAKGFTRCIDIQLMMKKNARLTAEEQLQKLDELKVKLLQQSLNLLPYRIVIDRQQA